MSAKKTINVSERVGVAESRIEGLLTQMSELKPDVKAIVKTLGEIQVHLAKLPTWEALERKATEAAADKKQVEERIAALEAARNSIKTGWTVVSFFGGVSVILIGWGLSIWLR